MNELSSSLSLEYLKEHKCQEIDCYNFSVRGYVFCEHHLYGFPRKMDDEDIKKLESSVKVIL